MKNDILVLGSRNEANDIAALLMLNEGISFITIDEDNSKFGEYYGLLKDEGYTVLRFNSQTQDFSFNPFDFISSATYPVGFSPEELFHAMSKHLLTSCLPSESETRRIILECSVCYLMSRANDTFDRSMKGLSSFIGRCAKVAYPKNYFVGCMLSITEKNLVSVINNYRSHEIFHQYVSSEEQEKWDKEVFLKVIGDIYNDLDILKWQGTYSICNETDLLWLKSKKTALFCDGGSPVDMFLYDCLAVVINRLQNSDEGEVVNRSKIRLYLDNEFYIRSSLKLMCRSENYRNEAHPLFVSGKDINTVSEYFSDGYYFETVWFGKTIFLGGKTNKPTKDYLKKDVSDLTSSEVLFIRRKDKDFRAYATVQKSKILDELLFCGEVV